jgi:hypothetical protein
METRNTNREEMRLLLSLRYFIIGNNEDYLEWSSSRFMNNKNYKIHKNYDPYSAWLLIARWVDENLYPQTKGVIQWSEGKRIEYDKPRSLFSLLQEHSSDTFYEELYGRFIQIETEKKVLSVFEKLGSPPMRTVLSGRVEQNHLDDELRMSYRELIRIATPTPEELKSELTPPPKPKGSRYNLIKR